MRNKTKAAKLLARTALSTSLLVTLGGCGLVTDVSRGVTPMSETRRTAISAQPEAQVEPAAEIAEEQVAQDQLVEQVMIGNGKRACYATPSAQETEAVEAEEAVAVSVEAE